jgi:hypothetical protein
MIGSALVFSLLVKGPPVGAGIGPASAFWRGDNYANNISLIDPTLSTRTKTDGIGLFTGQIGYAWNASLLYVKGGAAVRAINGRTGPVYAGLASKALSVGLSNAYFKSLGLPTLIETR